LSECETKIDVPQINPSCLQVLRKSYLLTSGRQPVDSLTYLCTRKCLLLALIILLSIIHSEPYLFVTLSPLFPSSPSHHHARWWAGRSHEIPHFPYLKKKPRAPFNLITRLDPLIKPNRYNFIPVLCPTLLRYTNTPVNAP